MSISQQYFIPSLIEENSTLSDNLKYLHLRMLATIPNIDRIACAIYHAKEGEIRTFINSSLDEKTLSNYCIKLADSPSLSRIAKSGESRVIDEIETAIDQVSLHSNWVRSEGYRSSFTIPMYDNSEFIGFIFFDSFQSSAFTSNVQRDIQLYATLIKMSISNELAAVHAITASVQIAKEFTRYRDFETGAHLERMARYAMIIAKGVSPIHKLTDEFIENIFLFAPLHDIGKISIPDSILLKPSKYNPEDRKVMETHVSKGMEIIQKILGQYRLEHLPDSVMMRNIVACHHEFLDGSGYPNALKAKDIPIEARIVTVADIFDALTSIRPYKAAWSIGDACAELQRMAELGKIDKDCVNAINTYAQEVSEIHKNFQDKNE